MNTPNPLVPQGTFAERGKSHIRITVFAILAIHVVLLGLLLIAGCNKKPPGDMTQDTGVPPVPPPPAGSPWPGPPTSAPPDTVSAPPTPVENLTPPPPGVVPGPASVANLVPPGQGTEVAVPATGFVEHTISKGESFYTLGKKYNVGYKAIVDANPGINPTRLKIGDKVKIPPAKAVASTASNGGAMVVNASDGTRSYKVKSGDNLMKIAKSYGVSVKQLRAANNLKTDQIRVGQTLKIPAASAPAPAEVVPPVPAVPPLSPPPAVSTPSSSP